MSDLRFSEKEADTILKRAIELQAKSVNAPREAHGDSKVSLQQLCHSAAEIGIDPNHVRMAAEEIAERSKGASKVASAAKTLEREFPVTISESDFPSLLAHLRSETDTPGTAQVIGGTLEWQGFVVKRGETIHVIVIPSGVVTRVKVNCTNPFARMRFVPLAFFAAFITIFATSIIPSFLIGFHFSLVLPLLMPFLAISFIVFGRRSFLFAGRRRPAGNGIMESIAAWMDNVATSRLAV